MDSTLLILEKRIETIENDLKSKVSITFFMWIIGLLVTILIVICSFLSSQISDVRKAQFEMQSIASITKEDVATIRGKLDPYNIEFKE